MKTALFIDIAGKQDYVFSSNKMKENVGASFIMRELALSETTFKKHGSFELAYCGGGNAMLFFETKDKAKEFVNAYSKAMLIAYPGLQLNFGFGEYDKENDNWKSCINGCIEDAQHNRNFNFMESKPFKPGIVADCPLSGDAQEVHNTATNKWYSNGINAKIEMSNKAHDEFNTAYVDALTAKFTMPKEIEDINIASEKNYVSIIHIDGNRMGAQFQECETLENYKTKSNEVKAKLSGCMEALIDYVVKLFNASTGLSNDGLIQLKKAGDKYILPFRPIINAGDDITFVCHGNLAIHLAEKYMELLNEQEISTCAGIAIVKKHYPFFRAYELSEKLAAEAKKKTRGEKLNVNPKNSCWLNFMIAPQGYSGNYDKMVESNYPNHARGPYCVIDNGHSIAQEKSFTHLKSKLMDLAYIPGSKWPRNKLLTVKNTLSKSDADKKLLIAELNAKDRYFSNTKTMAEELPEMKKFPYFDLVELINFYPESFLTNSNPAKQEAHV